MRRLLLFFPALLLAKEITLESLQTKPRSIARDYYIWRYLDQNITPTQAQSALELAQRVNKKILLRYSQKIADKEIAKAISCRYMLPSKLITKDTLCLTAGMSIAKASLLPLQQRIMVFRKLSDRALKNDLRFMLSSHPFIALRKSPQQFLKIYLHSSSSYKKRYFDKVYAKFFLQKLAKYHSFNAFASTAVFEEHEKIIYSLLRLPPRYFNAKSAFYLALAAYRRGLVHSSARLLQRSAKEAHYKKDRDKALFWLYRITKKPSYLQRLLQSKDLNIYTLIASSIAKKEYTNYCTPHLHGQKKIDLQNPFLWLNIRQQIKNEDLEKLKKEFAYENTQNIYALIIEKASGYTKHPFILPYEQYLHDQNISQKALIYAIARQESRFIPSAISHAFALGAMQFMPFLANHTAKKLKMKNFDLDMIFDEKIAIPFALDHLSYLEKFLHHPLLLAYAYNGGIGYTKHKVIKIFQKYEPLLAMEMIPSHENREYGKKVLSNYIIYMKIFGKKINPLHIVERLRQPLDSCDF